MTLSLIPPIWKEAPFLRILIPVATGIFLRENVEINQDSQYLILAFFFISFLLLHYTGLYFKFRYNWITGIFICCLLIITGYLICEMADDRNKENSIVKLYSHGNAVQLTIEEPLIEKERSYKALASVSYLSKSDSLINTIGKVNVYFSKDVNIQSLHYGRSIIVYKTLQPISNAGNPGAFDYQLYCRRQGIFYTVFLNSRDYELLPGNSGVAVKKFLFETRDKVLEILSTYIKGLKEQGLAKAMLIGYKDELDKNLVQAYSNTGVVHIIAISGLHLGIIYWLVGFALAPFQRLFRSRWATALIILACLWLFSLLAGAGPSVLRSAFMFSMIAVGNAVSKNSNVYNNLAFSAFALLCFNPYWLWDAGFQLSYAAVLSIVMFFRPIYNWIYFENKFLDFAWKLVAVTLAAQILTLPISVYHFHQLPIYFIFSNLLAVPLSSLMLVTEILLCCFAFFSSIGMALGFLITWMIQLLNTYVQNINQLPFAVWAQLQISFVQVILMFSLICGMATWLMRKAKSGMWIALTSLLAFLVIRAQALISTSGQLKLIVYNVPNGTAIDFINGHKFVSLGSNRILNDPIVGQYSLQPSRTLFGVSEQKHLNGFRNDGSLISFGGKLILHLNGSTAIPSDRIPVDILVLSNNSRLPLKVLIEKFSPQQIVADASNKAHNVTKWEAEARLQQVKFHNVKTEGAYVENLR